MGLNDAVHWSADLGGGTRVALIQAGTFRTDAGAILGPVPWILWRTLAEGELDANRRLLQALNCLLVETPAGRVLIETGIGERLDAKNTTMREVEGTPIVPALRGAGFDPATVDVVAMSHLHFDHAGGLLLADGTKAFPRARIVAQRSEWEIALGGNSRLVASYDQPELRLVADWGAEGWTEGDRELLPGVSVVRTGGHSRLHGSQGAGRASSDGEHWGVKAASSTRLETARGLARCRPRQDEHGQFFDWRRWGAGSQRHRHSAGAVGRAGCRNREHVARPAELGADQPGGSGQTISNRRSGGRAGEALRGVGPHER